MKAIWNNQVIAESDDTIVVEGNHYFPPDALNYEYLIDSNKHSSCYWKGQASYKHLLVNGKKNEDAVWYYPDPMSKAQAIKNYYAFWRGVEFVE